MCCSFVDNLFRDLCLLRKAWRNAKTLQKKSKRIIIYFKLINFVVYKIHKKGENNKTQQLGLNPSGMIVVCILKRWLKGNHKVHFQTNKQTKKTLNALEQFL